MFASRRIEIGETITNEKIAITLRKPSDGAQYYKAVYEAFKEASKEDQEQLLRLVPDPDPKLLEDLRKVFAEHEEPDRTRAIVVVSKYTNNCMDNGRHSWLSLAYGRINHSCLFNAILFKRSKTHQRLKAARDIKKGEEILISYMYPEGSAAARKEQLREWGVECTCYACSHGQYISVSQKNKEEWTEMKLTLREGDPGEDSQRGRAGPTAGPSSAR